jgi:CSLREA domain-containing protein
MSRGSTGCRAHHAYGAPLVIGLRLAYGHVAAAKEQPPIPKAGLLGSILLAAAAVAGPAGAATFTVTKPGDTRDGACNADCSLREAVTAANTRSGPDTIRLPGGFYALSRTGAADDTSAAGDLDVTGSVTFRAVGGRATVGGGMGERVFHVIGSARATFSGLWITGGSTSLAGGGIAVEPDASLTLLQTSVIDNATSSPEGGGGIFSRGRVTVRNTTIASNDSTGNGSHGAGIHNTSGANLTVAGSSVIANVVPGIGTAGGIFNDGTLRVSDTLVSGNVSAIGQGGGIETRGTATVTRSVLSGNRGGGVDGGGAMTPSTAAGCTTTARRPFAARRSRATRR